MHDKVVTNDFRRVTAP